MNRLEFKKSDPKIAWLVKLCYPGYRGRRTVKVEARETYRVADYWSEGSRNYAEFVHLPTRRVVRLDSLDYEQQAQSNLFNLTMGTVRLTPEVVAVENVIFCGKDMGVRIYVHPSAFNEFVE